MKQQKGAPWAGGALRTQIGTRTQRQGTPKGMAAPKENTTLHSFFPTPSLPLPRTTEATGASRSQVTTMPQLPHPRYPIQDETRALRAA